MAGEQEREALISMLKGGYSTADIMRMMQQNDPQRSAMAPLQQMSFMGEANRGQAGRDAIDRRGEVVERGELVPLGTYESGETALAWPKAAVDAVDSFKWLANNYTPGSGDPAVGEHGLNVGGAAAAGSMPFPRPQNSLSMFWGPKAARPAASPTPKEAPIGGLPAPYNKFREVDAPITPYDGVPNIAQAIAGASGPRPTLGGLFDLGTNRLSYPALKDLPVMLDESRAGANRAFHYRRGGGMDAAEDRIIYSPRVHQLQGEDAAQRHLYQTVQDAILHQEAMPPGRRDPLLPMPVNSPSSKPGIEQMQGTVSALEQIVKMRNLGHSDAAIIAAMAAAHGKNAAPTQMALKYPTSALQEAIETFRPGTTAVEPMEAKRLFSRIRASGRQSSESGSQKLGYVSDDDYKRSVAARSALYSTQLPNKFTRDGADRQMAMDRGDRTRLMQPFAGQEGDFTLLPFHYTELTPHVRRPNPYLQPKQGSQ